MDRDVALEDLYRSLATLIRRSRERSDELHPGLSIVEFTLLSQLQITPDARAADLSSYFGLDKSTLSRQLDRLIDAGLLRRAGERPGRRGQRLVVTANGHDALAMSADSIRARLAEWLLDWDDADITAFARLVERFNRSTGADTPGA
jgi:DNA-binding MarR family transcriptional regulator